MNSRLEQTLKLIVRKSPLALRNVIVSCAGARKNYVRYGGQYQFWLTQARTAETWDSAEARRYQVENLIKLVSEAVSHTDFYRDHFGAFNDAALVELCSEFRLSELPLLQKSDRKSFPDKFMNRVRRPVLTTYTSGTSGSPMIARYDSESSQRSLAVLNRLREWIGVPDRPRHARLGGHIMRDVEKSAKNAWGENYFEKQLLVSTYHLGAEDDHHLMDKIRAYDPLVIEGYPSSVATLAQRIKPEQIPTSLRGIITTAETLHDEVRQMIEEKFRVRVFDYYGASEGVPVIQQCEEGVYHMRLDNGIFEILDEHGVPAVPGDIGELVVTSFRQWMMPLIRYRTGDMVETSRHADACRCGRTLPVTKRVLGRDEDMVVARDGRRIGMFSYRTLKMVKGLERSQIVQETPTKFCVRIIPDGTAPLEAIHRELTTSFSTVLGYPVDLRTELVCRFQPGQNGKIRATIRMF